MVTKKRKIAALCAAALLAVLAVSGLYTIEQGCALAADMQGAISLAAAGDRPVYVKGEATEQNEDYIVVETIAGTAKTSHASARVKGWQNTVSKPLSAEKEGGRQGGLSQIDRTNAHGNADFRQTSVEIGICFGHAAAAFDGTDLRIITQAAIAGKNVNVGLEKMFGAPRTEFWLWVGIAVASLLIAILLICLLFRRYTLALKRDGEILEVRKKRGGQNVNLPQNYDWFEDAALKIPFSAQRMPRKNIILYAAKRTKTAQTEIDAGSKQKLSVSTGVDEAQSYNVGSQEKTQPIAETGEEIAFQEEEMQAMEKMFTVMEAAKEIGVQAREERVSNRRTQANDISEDEKNLEKEEEQARPLKQTFLEETAKVQEDGSRNIAEFGIDREKIERKTILRTAAAEQDLQDIADRAERQKAEDVFRGTEDILREFTYFTNDTAMTLVVREQFSRAAFPCVQPGCLRQETADFEEKEMRKEDGSANLDRSDSDLLSIDFMRKEEQNRAGTHTDRADALQSDNTAVEEKTSVQAAENPAKRKEVWKAGVLPEQTTVKTAKMSANQAPFSKSNSGKELQARQPDQRRTLQDAKTVKNNLSDRTASEGKESSKSRIVTGVGKDVNTETKTSSVKKTTTEKVGASKGNQAGVKKSTETNAGKKRIQETETKPAVSKEASSKVRKKSVDKNECAVRETQKQQGKKTLEQRAEDASRKPKAEENKAQKSGEVAAKPAHEISTKKIGCAKDASRKPKTEENKAQKSGEIAAKPAHEISMKKIGCAKEDSRKPVAKEGEVQKDKVIAVKPTREISTKKIGYAEDASRKTNAKENEALKGGGIAKVPTREMSTKKVGCAERMFVSKRKTRGRTIVLNADTLGMYFRDGDIVNADTLKAAGLICREDAKIKILARGNLNKRLTVVANDFSAEAVKMIVMTGGTIVIEKP